MAPISIKWRITRPSCCNTMVQGRQLIPLGICSLALELIKERAISFLPIPYGPPYIRHKSNKRITSWQLRFLQVDVFGGWRI